MSDFNEFDFISIVMRNVNEDSEGLKEGFEKGEVIENIRGNGGQLVGIQRTKTLNVQVWMWNDD